MLVPVPQALPLSLPSLPIKQGPSVETRSKVREIIMEKPDRRIKLAEQIKALTEKKK